jgi:hypothetical protein
MFKISIVDTQGQRRLVLEGTLVRPWTAEVETVWRSAGEQLQGRKLIIDLTNVTLISRDGENTLFKLMSDGAKFTCGGVLTKHVLKQLARRWRGEHTECRFRRSSNVYGRGNGGGDAEHEENH